jgi:hypothetical protein
MKEKKEGSKEKKIDCRKGTILTVSSMGGKKLMIVKKEKFVGNVWLLIYVSW